MLSGTTVKTNAVARGTLAGSTSGHGHEGPAMKPPTSLGQGLRLEMRSNPLLHVPEGRVEGLRCEGSAH